MFRSGFIPDVAVDAFASEGRIGHIARDFLGTAFLAGHFCFVQFGDFQLHHKILFALTTSVIIMGHKSFLQQISKNTALFISMQ